MLRKLFLFLVLAVFTFGMSKLSFAMMCGDNSEHNQGMQAAQAGGSGHSHEEAMSETNPSSEEAVNVGNKICPVSGEKINEKTKATYEYKGKIYNFCCPMCLEDFKKDPGKYIKKVDEELKKGSETKSNKQMIMPESEELSGMGGSEHHSH